MRFLAIVVMLLAQNNFPLPTTQPLPSPTAYPTAAPTVTPAATVYYPLVELDNSLATAEAELAAPMQVSIPPSIEFLANAFGFIQYISVRAQNLFGPFAPIFQFALFFTPIALILFVTYVGNLVVTTIYSMVSDVYRKIRG